MVGSIIRVFRVIRGPSIWLLSLIVAHAAPPPPASAQPRSLTLQKIGEYPLQSSRQGAAAIAHNDLIYILGGGDLELLTDIERFDPRTNRSEKIFDKLIPRRYHRAVEFKGRIYLFGGLGNPAPGHPYQYQDTVEIYDIAANTVTRGARMPEARAHMATARLGDKILVCGGVKLRGNQRVHTNQVDIYDPATDRWSVGVPMPTAREGQAVAVGDTVIVPAGYRTNTELAVVESFDSQGTGWKTLPPLARPVSAHSVVALDKYLFFFGDYANVDLVLVYDLSTQQTLPVTAKFEGYRHTAAVVSDRKIFVIGGNNDTAGHASDLIQVFALP
jgi:N-acetylneuraminic acid mutarotase